MGQAPNRNQQRPAPTQQQQQRNVLLNPDMPHIEPQVARPRRQRACLGVMGAPGSGKTKSSLIIAGVLRALDQDNRPILVIDAQHGQILDEAKTWNLEHGEGSLVWIDWLAIDPKCHPKVLLRWLRQHAHEYAAVIVDPLTRFWEGARDWQDALKAGRYMGGDGYACWGPVTETWNELMELFQKAPTHFVVIARMKDKKEKVDGEWASIGMQPQWREETTYELGSVVEVLRPVNGRYMHKVWRTRGDQPFEVDVPREDIARFATEYHEWLTAGTDPEPLYSNPELESHWAEIRDRYRSLDDDTKDQARIKLTAANLIHPESRMPLVPFTWEQLERFAGIVDEAFAAARDAAEPALAS